MLVICNPALAGGSFLSFVACLAGIVSGVVNKAVQFKAVLLALNPTSLTIRTLAQRVPVLIHR